MKGLINKFQPGGNIPSPDYVELRLWMKANLSDDEITQLNLHGITPDLLLTFRLLAGSEQAIKAIKNLASKPLTLKANPKESPMELSASSNGDASIFNPYSTNRNPNTANGEHDFTPSMDPEAEWQDDPKFPEERMLSKHGEIATKVGNLPAYTELGEIKLGYDDSAWYNTPGNLYDEAVRLSGQNYNHPLGGALARWQASWENDTNPVKAALEKTPAGVTPQGLFANSVIGLLGNNGVRKTGRILQDVEKLPKEEAAGKFITEAVPSMAGDAVNGLMAAIPAVGTTTAVSAELFDRFVLDPRFRFLLRNSLGEERAIRAGETLDALGQAAYYKRNPQALNAAENYFSNARFKSMVPENSTIIWDSYDFKDYPEYSDAMLKNLFNVGLKNGTPTIVNGEKQIPKVLYNLETLEVLNPELFARTHNLRWTGKNFTGIARNASVSPSILGSTLHVNLYPGNNQGVHFDALPQSLQNLMLLIQKEAPAGTHISSVNIPSAGEDLYKYIKRGRSVYDSHGLTRPKLKEFLEKIANNRTDGFNYNLSSLISAMKTGNLKGNMVTFKGVSSGFNNWNMSSLLEAPHYAKMRKALIPVLERERRIVLPKLPNGDIDASKLAPHLKLQLENFFASPRSWSKEVQEVMKETLGKKIKIGKEDLGLLFGTTINGDFGVKFPIVTKLDRTTLRPSLGWADYIGSAYDYEGSWLQKMLEGTKPYWNLRSDWGAGYRKHGGNLIVKKSK